MTHPAKLGHSQALACNEDLSRSRPLPNAAEPAPSSSSTDQSLGVPYHETVAALEKELVTTRERADAQSKEANALRKRVEELEPEVRRLVQELEGSRRGEAPWSSASRSPATPGRQAQDNDVALGGSFAAAESQASILQLRCEKVGMKQKVRATTTAVDESGNIIKENGVPEAKGADEDDDQFDDVGVKNVDARLIKKQLKVAERRVKNSRYINEAHETMAAKATEREREANARASELERRLWRAVEKLESIQRRDTIAGLSASCYRDEGSIHDAERELRVDLMDPELDLPINTAKRRKLAHLKQRLLRLRRRHESQLAALRQARAVERLHSDLRGAAASGDLAETKRLLQTGISVNAPDETGLSAFFYACGQSNEDLVRAMVDAGGDVLDGDGSITGLIIAASKGFIRVAQTLINKGADLHARDSAGGTALHSSVLGGHVELSRVLLEAGSDCNAVDKGINAPLHLLAAPSAHPADESVGAQLAALLLEWGASANIKNSKGLTPITAALEAKRKPLVVAYEDFFGGAVVGLGAERDSGMRAAVTKCGEMDSRQGLRQEGKEGNEESARLTSSDPVLSPAVKNNTSP